MARPLSSAGADGRGSGSEVLFAPALAAAFAFEAASAFAFALEAAAALAFEAAVLGCLLAGGSVVTATSRAGGPAQGEERDRASTGELGDELLAVHTDSFGDVVSACAETGSMRSAHGDRRASDPGRAEGDRMAVVVRPGPMGPTARAGVTARRTRCSAG